MNIIIIYAFGKSQRQQTSEDQDSQLPRQWVGLTLQAAHPIFVHNMNINCVRAVEVFRGPVDDVLNRCLRAVRVFEADIIGCV